MDKKIVVFDFDKTLTYKDTLFGFFIFASRKNIIFPFKVLLYYLMMVTTKLNLVSNDFLKRIGISLFIKNRSIPEIKAVSIEYVRKIKFNDLYNRYNFNSDDDIYVVSASFRDYLIVAFPDRIKIIGSELKQVDNKIKGLKFNCYKDQKVTALKNAGVIRIDELFTDSYNDYEMAKISNKITLVKGDDLYECGGIENFKNYFRK